MNFEERFDRIETNLELVGQQTEKNTAGIRDLIRVSTIFLEQQKQVMVGMDTVDARMEALREENRTWFLGFRERQERDHEEWTLQMKELRELQAETEQKLNILIDTVDRIIRNKNGNKPS